jgi:hypothetical protein
MPGWRITIGAVAGALLVAAAAAPAAGAARAASTREITNAGVLRSSDFPDGYASQAHDRTSDTETQKRAAKLPDCKRLVGFRAAVDRTPKAQSPDFTTGTSTVSNTVNVFPTVAKARAALTSFAASGVVDCFDALVGQVASSAGGSVEPDLGRTTDVGVGDQSVAFEGPVQITEKDGSTSTLSFGVLAARFGRVVTVFNYSSGDDISAVVQHATDESSARLRAALG